jgi:hypothetical protein
LFIELTPSIIGGILMILANYLVYKGYIYYATVVFLFVNICFVIVTFQIQDLFGMFTIIIGILFGFLTFYKMKTGKFTKTLQHP